MRDHAALNDAGRYVRFQKLVQKAELHGHHDAPACNVTAYSRMLLYCSEKTSLPMMSRITSELPARFRLTRASVNIRLIGYSSMNPAPPCSCTPRSSIFHSTSDDIILALAPMLLV